MELSSGDGYWPLSALESKGREGVVSSACCLLTRYLLASQVARRLAKLAHAPFIKVEATKFTEVGFVGKDVDQV